jgi:hypothetical protein
MICYQNSVKSRTAVPCPPQQFWKAVDSPATKAKIETRRGILRAVKAYLDSGDKQHIERWLQDSNFQMYCLNEEAKDDSEVFRGLTMDEKLTRYGEEQKSSLECFIFGAREFDEIDDEKKPGKKICRRQLSGIHLNGLFMFDADHLTEDPKAVFERTQAEGFPWEVVLAHLTSSGEGLRLVCKVRMEIGNIAANQAELAKALGVKTDDSTIDASRTSFAPMREDIYLINEAELFGYYNEAFDKKYCNTYRKGHTKAIYADPTLAANDEETPVEVVEEEDDGEPIDWVGYDIQDIINARYGNKLPSKHAKCRHNESLKLAADLLIMMDGDVALTLRILKRQSWVMDIIKERGLQEQKDILTFADKKKRENEKENKVLPIPSKEMRAAIEKATGKTYFKLMMPGIDNKTPLPVDEWGAELEKMFKTFPLMYDVCKGRHLGAYPSIVFIASALMGTLMTRTWYHFYYEPTEERRLNYSIFVIGDPSAGKSVAGKLYKLLAKPIIDADSVGNEAINRYKRTVKERNTSDKEKKKEALKEPDPIIRCFGSRTANGVFIENMVRAVDQVGQKEIHLHLLTFDSELDNQTNLTKGGSWIDKSVFELKAFHNEEDSQSYKNTDSINGPFDVFWNFIYTGTPISLRKKVNERNFGTGLATRLACIPMPSSNFEMVELNPTLVTDTTAEDAMREWALKLDKVSGELPIWPLVEHTWHWCYEHMQLAKVGLDYADEMLIKRVPYYGISVAMPFILMRHWEEWEQHHTITFDKKDFALSTLVMNIQYACQHYFFGEYARNYFADKDRDSTTRNRSTRYMDCFAQLSEEFSHEDVQKVFGVNKSTAYTIVSRFKKDQVIRKITNSKNFRKIKKTL